MITMNEFINSTNKTGKNELPAQKQHVKNETKILNQKTDSFEKANIKSKKVTKKQRNIIIAAIITGVALVTAFLKRKDISGFFSNLFKKKSCNIDTKKKPASDITNIQKTSERISSSFPSKPFTDTPAPEQKKEYVDSLLKYLASSKPSTGDKVRAINEINKYGIDDLDKMVDYLSDDNDEIIQATLQTFAKWGNQKYANRAICPFLSPESSLTSRSKTYIEALKTVQKLADLSD